MSDFGHTTRIDSPFGPMHTGGGNQYNNFVAGAMPTVRKAADPLHVALDQQRWLRRRFVEPPGYGKAAERLEQPGSVVLLSGFPGSGRRSAAIMLLHSAGDESDGVRELPPYDDDKEEAAKPLAGARLLFDLSSIDEQQFLNAQAKLGEYWEQIRHLGARLAVVLPYEHEHLLRSEFRQLLVPIGRPNAALILARHLRPTGIRVSLSEVHGSVLKPLLLPSPVRELQRLAELVAQASATKGDFGTWAQAAIDALNERSNEAAQQIAELTDGRERALLFAVAMLDGAPVDAVFRCADRLLTTLGHPPDDRPRLEHSDPTQRLRALNVSFQDQRAGFSLLAYSSAVRAHFWLYYPDLRASFGAWVAEVIREHTWLDAGDRQRLVARYVEQALRAGDVAELIALVESWASDTRLLSEAAQILEIGLTHEQHAATFRAKTYDWSISPNLPANLVGVLTRACVAALAPNYPYQALVRLHHLARNEPDRNPPYAKEALFELVWRDGLLYRRLLDRVGDGMNRRDPIRADADVFLRLVTPPRPWLPSAATVRGWHGVLTVATPDSWTPTVRTWLSVAQGQPDGGAELTRILLAAADGRTDVLSRFYLLACDWAAEPDHTQLPLSRVEVATRFCAEIDRAQGIEPLEPASAGATEGGAL